jgi:putative tryptophan/tyrosine transport system substrate-binding protein
MRRRDCITILGGAIGVWPLVALGQDARRLPKIAILSPNTLAHAQDESGISTVNNMLRSLAELGYLDGKSVTLEFRFAERALERLPALAAELVARQPDVLYTFSSGAARAAAAATSTIPIVVAPVYEPVMAGIVPDFAHPPGNVTGLTLASQEQYEKCLQLLREAAPSVTRVGVLLNPLNPGWQNYPEVLADASKTLGLVLVRMEARGLGEVEQAFDAAAAEGIDGLFGLSDSTLVGTTAGIERIVGLIRKHHLPSVSDETDFARRGGLLSLGPDFVAIGQRAAEYIDRILQGAKVAELPVERPAEFKLIVNLKTAQELGITIPPAILLRADEVIE